MRTREDKRMVKLGRKFSFGYILKKSAHSFFGAWSFLLVHIWLTPSEGCDSNIAVGMDDGVASLSTEPNSRRNPETCF